MDFVIKEGIVEVGAVDQLDQRFPVQDRKYLFAKFNVDEMKNSDKEKMKAHKESIEKSFENFFRPKKINK